MAVLVAQDLDFDVPGALEEALDEHPSVAKAGGGFTGGALETGAAFGFGWTPCATPVLASVLAVAASGSDVARAAGLLIAYSLGLGLPCVAVSLAFGRLAGALAVARRHAVALMSVGTAAMAGYGVLLVLNRLSWVTTHLQTLSPH